MKIIRYLDQNNERHHDVQLVGGKAERLEGDIYTSRNPSRQTDSIRKSLAPVVPPNALGVRTILNGETVQDWNTNDMIFDVPALIGFLSGSTTFLPGTVILTGTPHGVGMTAKPPRWIKPRDSGTIEIENIGRLTNPVVLESSL